MNRKRAVVRESGLSSNVEVVRKSPERSGQRTFSGGSFLRPTRQTRTKESSSRRRIIKKDFCGKKVCVLLNKKMADAPTKVSWETLGHGACFKVAQPSKPRFPDELPQPPQ